jgi:hypothetical protein
MILTHIHLNEFSILHVAVRHDWKTWPMSQEANKQKEDIKKASSRAFWMFSFGQTCLDVASSG